jgi:multicomponent Na+:H+ antiporter subunit G
MDLALDIATWAFVVAGAFFLIVGSIGLIRLKDVYARMHAASLIDTLGVGLVLVGLCFQAGFTLTTAKLLMILAFVFFTSPTATYALARAALAGGVHPEVSAEGRELSKKSAEADG